METSRKALRLTASVCLLALAACSGGGGGGSVNTTPTNTSNSSSSNSSSSNSSNSNSSGSNSSSGNSSSSNTNTSTPTVSIAAPSISGPSGFLGQGTSFTTNTGVLGITLGGAAAKVTSTTVSDASIPTITADISGTSPGGTVLVNLTVPSLGLSNVVLNATTGAPFTFPDGRVVNMTTANMTYTLMASWSFTVAGGSPGYIGQYVTGYNTTPSGVPTSGTASYSGTTSTAGSGGVRGAYAVPTGTGTIQGGALTGDITFNANFANNTATGTLSNMMATPATGGSATPWNNVSLSGTLSRSSPGAVTMNGSATTAGAPANAGAAGFSSGATGSFAGLFYGPAAQEVGGTWSLSESAGGGKAAFGTFGAK